MSALQVFQFFGISLIPSVVAIATHLFFKHYSNKFSYWIKQLIIGVLFGGLSIVGYFLGVKLTGIDSPLLPDSNTFTVGNSTIPPVIAGVLFGWPAGLISAFIGALFRYFQFDFLRIPTTIAIAFSGIISSSLTHFLFHDHRPKWYLCVLCATFVEIFNILLIFIFNLNNINETYALLSIFDFVCIIFSAVSLCISSLAIFAIDHKRILPHKKDFNNVAVHIQTILFTICTVGLAIVSVMAYGTTQSKANKDYTYTISNAIDNITRDIIDYSIGLIDEGMETAVGTESLMRFIGGYDEGNPDKHGVSDRHNVSYEGSVNICAGEKIKEWIDNNEPLKSRFGFIDEGVVIGVSKNSDFDIGDMIKIDNQITADISYDKDDLLPVSYRMINGNRYLLSIRRIDYSEIISPLPGQGTVCYVIVKVPFNEVYSAARISFRVVFYTAIMVFILIFVISSYFIHRKILNRIKDMDRGLEKIMSGDLEYELRVEGYNEFKNLNNNINLAVGALKNYASEVQHRIDAELLLARDIQLGSVLKVFPSDNDYNIFAKMEPAREVGGDFYDYVKMNNGRVMFVIADVSGKGVPAALFMMRSKTLIKSFASTDMSLSDIVRIVNNDLCKQNEAGLFVTAWIGILNTKNGELRYVSAGHPNPIVKHNGLFTEFKTKHNPALAVFPNIVYETEIAYFEPGDELVLFTDGVTEAQNMNNDLYGIDRLLSAVNKAKYFNAKQLLDEITDDIVKFAEDAEQSDDITLLIIRYLGDTKSKVPETSITLKARSSNASIAGNFVESILIKFKLSDLFISKILIVVDELFANVAFYAYPKDYVGEVTIEVDVREDCLYLNFIDSGKEFDPTKPIKANLGKKIEECQPGGLGIYIVKKTMDEMHYEYKDRQNVLRLMKKISIRDLVKEVDEE